MKIIGLVGIVDLQGSDDRLWNNVRYAFRGIFPDATICVEHSFYFPWQRRALKKYADAVLKVHDDGDDVIMFGYSLGGVVARYLAPQYKRSTVRAVITVSAPHKLHRFFGLRYQAYDGLVLSVSGSHDVVVPRPLTKTDGAEAVSVRSGHYFRYARDREFLCRVVENACENISR